MFTDKTFICCDCYNTIIYSTSSVINLCYYVSDKYKVKQLLTHKSSPEFN